MKRRTFIKALGALGVTAIAPDIFTKTGLIGNAHAYPEFNGADAPVVSVPAVTPQVINIFLYGGASELAGNLTNIQDINNASQSKYNDPQGQGNPAFLETYDPINANPNALAQGNVGQLTPNAFWAHAGGIIMEDMLLSGDMTVYRTCNRRKNNTRAHRPSIFSTLKGTLDIDNAPGIGTTLASVIAANSTVFEAAFGKPLEELVMPMVSFEGESTLFAPDPNATSQLPLSLKSIGLSADFDNPYARSFEPAEADQLDDLVDERIKANPDSVEGDPDFDELSDEYGERFKKVSESFLNHRKLAIIVDSYAAILDDPNSLPLLPEGDPDGSNPDFSTPLYNAYQSALGGNGRNFIHHNPDYNPEDPLYTDPTPLGSEGSGLDTRWVLIPDANDASILNWELRFFDFQGLTILNPDTDTRINVFDENGDPIANPVGQANRLVYPQDNRFAELLQAAVTLAIYNKDTKFIQVGSPGLGGWDDHNSAMVAYEDRMQTLMSAVRAATKHIKYAFDASSGMAVDPLGTNYRDGQSTDNIIINISTDFGRNANLNLSKGWDHGNTQCFYTFGGRPYIRDDTFTYPNGSTPADLGTPQPVVTIDKYHNLDMTQISRAAIQADIDANPALTTPPAVRPPGALGKIVGTTHIFGTPGQNRLFTKPSHPNDDTSLNSINFGYSYEFEPQAIASTVYSWFGVTNPEVLTKNDGGSLPTSPVSRVESDGSGNVTGETTGIPVTDGEPPIDENLPSVHTDANPLPVKNIVTVIT